MSLLQTGSAIVILTQGAEGAVGFLADGTEVQIPAVTADVVDTVGAGDTFNAGVLAKLSEMGHLTKPDLRALAPEAWREAMMYGARASAVTVSRAGANPPWAEEL